MNRVLTLDGKGLVIEGYDIRISWCYYQRNSVGYHYPDVIVYFCTNLTYFCLVFYVIYKLSIFFSLAKLHVSYTWL